METLIYFFPGNSPSFEPYGEVLRHENLGKLISYYEELGDFKNWPYFSCNGLRTLKNTRHVYQMMDFLEPLNDFWLSTLAWSLCLPSWHTGLPWAVPYLFLALFTTASNDMPQGHWAHACIPMHTASPSMLQSLSFSVCPTQPIPGTTITTPKLTQCCLH